MSTKMKPYVCVHCGHVEEDTFDGKRMEKMVKFQHCYTCSFWQDKLSAFIAGDRRCVRVSGRHFYIGDESPDWGNSCKGFGGARFTIRFDDGREVETTNLWHQGEIPENWQGLLPDNAVFVEGGSVPFGCKSVPPF